MRKKYMKGVRNENDISTTTGCHHFIVLVCLKVKKTCINKLMSQVTKPTLISKCPHQSKNVILILTVLINFYLT